LEKNGSVTWEGDAWEVPDEFGDIELNSDGFILPEEVASPLSVAVVSPHPTPCGIDLPTFA
jgi:hypothetical protein